MYVVDETLKQHEHRDCERTSTASEGHEASWYFIVLLKKYNTIQQQQKTHKKSKQTNNTQKIIKKHMKIYIPKKWMWENFIRKPPVGFELMRVYGAAWQRSCTFPLLYFSSLYNTWKNKQLKLVLDFTCNNVFTQQFRTITAITLKFFKRLFMIFYAALWLKWNQKWSILFERAHRVLK